MMWLEACLASLLVLGALALALNAPPPTHPLLEFSSYQQLDDKAATLVEIQTRVPSVPPAPVNLGANNAALSGVFSSSDAFCYLYYWSGQPGDVQYSSDECQSAFTLPPSLPVLRSVRRGAWKDGQTQFLTVEQFGRP